MSKRRDGQKNGGTLAVAEHVGVETSVRQTGATLAHRHAAGGVAEAAWSRVKRSTPLTHFTPCLLGLPLDIRQLVKDTK